MCINVTKEFAVKLQSLIIESGKSIKQLAVEIGVPSGSLSKYQNNAAEPGINSLYKIADYFNVSADYLLGITDQRTSNIDDKAIHETIGLSDKAIEKLKGYKKYLPGVLIPTINSLIEYEDDPYHLSMSESYSKITTVSEKEIEDFITLLSELKNTDKESHESNDCHPVIPSGPLKLIDDFFNFTVANEGQLRIDSEVGFIGTMDSQKIIDTLIIDDLKEVLRFMREKSISNRSKIKIRHEEYAKDWDEVAQNTLFEKLGLNDSFDDIIKLTKKELSEIFEASDDFDMKTPISNLIKEHLKEQLKKEIGDDLELDKIIEEATKEEEE
ncbi:helix-turn-helix transcriptional regulator [uncultured Acetobacterium sp.]|uniref:helix-turn-helix domain-containing protein n=1 Tax=uncultured Acetobacterium sp. TaxID=217139 RepID=UPI0025CD668F|nr:helix-turn-helix transcriptional regulator [uncultured Acetobacterium sp.]